MQKEQMTSKEWWMQDSTVHGSIILLFFLLLTMSGLKAQSQVTLDWNVIHPKNGSIIPLGNAGTVQQALIASGELPDPYYGTNENLFNWIEEHQWTLVSQFEVSNELMEFQYIDLELPNVDVYASIYLNDSFILKTENAFRPYYVDVKNWLKEGKNEIRAVFTPPIRYHKETWDTAAFHYPAPNDLNKIAIAPLTRKPQYQFGWDWALRMNTIGFNKPVQLIGFNQNRILGKNIQTMDIQKDKAWMRFVTEFRYPINGDVEWKSHLFKKFKVNSGGRMIEADYIIEHPELWWPRGHGQNHLYEDVWSIKFGKYKEDVLVKFGIRKAELIQEKDQWGTSYVVRINGKDIFCKGADYIPMDMFPSRVTDDAIDDLVYQMRLANFNMVRVWGGGYYPDEKFYERCDEDGIMVWQDLMFACAMYPGDSAFLANVKEEIEYQIPRFTSHPSVVLVNGNNEVEVAWGNWGFQSTYSLDSLAQKTIAQDYDRLFKELAPSVIEEFTTVPYVHTSPLSNWGKEEYYNHGTQHYWGVWHGADPIEGFTKNIGRFNAEYGFQSFPQASTLLTFSDTSQWQLESEVMKHHQKSYVGNGMIAKHSDRLYGKTEDFNEFVYFSQLTQAKAVEMAVSGHRIDWPRCTGTLVWQLNDCWPAPTWSSIDYYGNWKILHHRMRDCYQDVTVLAKEEELGKEEYYLVSDYSDTFYCELTFTVYDLDGKEIFTNNISQYVNGRGATKLCVNSLCDIEEKEYIIKYWWRTRSRGKGERIFIHQEMKREKPSIEQVEIEITGGNDGGTSYRYFIHVKNEVALLDFWVTPLKTNVYSRNTYNTLLPGNHKFMFISNEPLGLEDFKVFYR